MVPQQLQSILGIKGESDFKMANNIWKMLDEMSTNDPKSYQQFIQKNLKEGFNDIKKQKKQKHSVIPKQFLLLEMSATLHQQIVGNQSQQERKIKEMFDMSINKDKWENVKAKYPQKVRIFLNICHSNRIKNPTSKSKIGSEITNFTFAMLNDIECLYYSIQGPLSQSKNHSSPPVWYFAMIFNTNFLKGFETVSRKIFLGLAVSYFQQRLKRDKNPAITKLNIEQLYNKKLYYSIIKQSVVICEKQNFKYGNENKVCQFILEQEVDTKSQTQASNQQNQQRMPINSQSKDKQIMIKQPSKIEEPDMNILSKQNKQNKKILIQQIKQVDYFDKNDYSIPYQMSESQDGYSFQFLVGTKKISDVDLQVSNGGIRIKTLDSNPARSLKIVLKKMVDTDKIWARMKKKSDILKVDLKFIE